MALPPISDSARLVASPDVMATRVGAELVVLNLQDGVYYSLDEAGIRIWELLQAPVTVPAISQALVSEYEVEEARCDGDVRTFVAELASRGLVQVQEDR